jgi:carbonic anhydrase
MNHRQIKAAEALAMLRDGNERFVDGDRCIDTYLSHTRLDEHLGGQAPYAIVLGCSDSRVPVEIIFDAGLGDLFVIRVAGNIVAPSLVGSVELAAEAFGSRLVVVLGHSGCGAVDFALSTLETRTARAPGNVNAIVKKIRPVIEPLIGEPGETDRDTLMDLSVRANVRASVDALRHGSRTLERLIREDGLLVVGAEYSLETGKVEFFEGLPDRD